MIFLETDLAVYKRLTGYPLDNTGRPLLDANGVPKNREIIGPPDLNGVEHIFDAEGVSYPLNPVLPSYGIRIPTMLPPFRNQRSLSSRDPDALRAFIQGFDANSFRQVPVFDENITGVDFQNVWPCVSFRWSELEYAPGTFIYHDPFEQFNTTGSPATNIVNAQGEVIESGYSGLLIRPHPESWSPLYTITAWSKDKMEMMLIADQIMQMFPGKGALNVTWKSGEVHACDMLLQRVVTLDEGHDEVQRTQSPEAERYFARAFVYLIEGYRDNTTNQFGTQDITATTNILQRLLEIDTLMAGVAQQPSTDGNSQELEPIRGPSIPGPPVAV